MAERPEEDLQDVGNKVPEIVFLDFSKAVILTPEELKSALWKVPDLRLRHDRLWDEEVLCNSKNRGRDYPFGNPVPSSLVSVRIRDLSQVDIDWRMMTLLRPNTKMEEDIFSRMIQLDRLKQETALEKASINNRLLPQRSSRTQTARIKQPVGSDEDEDVNASQDSLTYQYYQREEEIDPEDRLTKELSISIALAALENKKHRSGDQKKVDDNCGRRKRRSKGRRKELASKSERSAQEHKKTNQAKSHSSKRSDT